MIYSSVARASRARGVVDAWRAAKETFGKPQRRACQLSRSLQILTEERTTHEQSTEAVTLTGKRLQDSMTYQAWLRGEDCCARGKCGLETPPTLLRLLHWPRWVLLASDSRLARGS